MCLSQSVYFLTTLRIGKLFEHNHSIEQPCSTSGRLVGCVRWSFCLAICIPTTENSRYTLLLSGQQDKKVKKFEQVEHWLWYSAKSESSETA